MPLSTKIIRRRIRSVKNTQKITKAMELVSAAKMRRAVTAVLTSRAYAHTAAEVVMNLSRRTGPRQHPLLKHRPVKRACYVLLSSNRGLCGGFNTQVTQAAIRSHELERVPAEWYVLGRKGGEALVRAKKNVVADFVRPDVATGMADITALSHALVQKYMAGEYDAVYLGYTDFHSSLVQKPRVKQLLPVTARIDETLGETAATQHQLPAVQSNIFDSYLFEPNAAMVLDFFLRQLVDVQVYQALLESSASEHAARMLAMRQANDAATDMIDDLTLVFNKARQSNITREISEISAGMASVS